MKKKLRIAFIIIVIIALAASMGWTYYILLPEPTVPVSQVSLKAYLDYQIVSGKSLTLWPAGTVFQQGEIAYFYAAEPKIKVSPTLMLYGLDKGEITGTIETETSLQAVNDKAEIYWSYNLNHTAPQPITFSKDGQAGAAAEYVAEGTELDAVSSYDLVTKIGEELLFRTGQLQLVVSSRIHLTGSVNGNTIDKQMNITLPFILQQSSFSAPQVTDTTAEAVLAQSPQAPSLWQHITNTAVSFPYPFVADAVLLIILMILLWSKDAKAKALLEHKRFKAWITEGSVDLKNKYSINIFSLEGLVDLAIDLDKRVIFDPKQGKYYVIEENIVYLYDPEHKNILLNNKQQLGKFLLERGIITPEQLETGLYYQQKTGSKLGESLTALGFLNESALYSALASQLGIDYYELDSYNGIYNNEFLELLSISKAKVFQAVPLGKRADGKLVVACGDIFKKGLKEALEELLHTGIHIVAAKPSSVYALLNRIVTEDDRKSENQTSEPEGEVKPYQSLSAAQREQFIEAYNRGTIEYTLFLKAGRKVDPYLLENAPDRDNIINWLVNNSIIKDSFANLLKGLDKAVEALDYSSRHGKQVPELINLLSKSDYLSEESISWISSSCTVQKLPVDKFLSENYLVSEETLINSEFILKILKEILFKA